MISYVKPRRFTEIDMTMLKANGFTLVGNIEVRGKFFYIIVIKK